MKLCLNIALLITLFLLNSEGVLAWKEKCPIPNKYDRFLVRPFYFEKEDAKKNRPYRHGCVYFDKKTEQARLLVFKAENDAVSRSWGQAEKKVSTALDLLSTEDFQHFRCKWLLLRAKIRIVKGKKIDAITDIKNALKFKRYCPILLAARLLIDAGDYKTAEKILLPNVDRTGARLYHYYLGLAQEHTSKDKAVESLLKAANLFMRRGQTDSAEYCLKRINRLGNGQYSLKDLKPPRNCVDKFKKILVEMATNPKCFEHDVSEGSDSFSFPSQNGETTSIAYDKCFIRVEDSVLRNGVKRMLIRYKSNLCGLTKADCAEVLKDIPKIPFPQLYNQEIVATEGFKVPSGFLALSYLKGGFEPITTIELFTSDNPDLRRRSVLSRESGNAEKKK